MSVLNCSLDLIFPPISNQEGVWIWEDEEVREYVKRSKLYMLVHRRELKFIDIDVDSMIRGIFRFKISMGNFTSGFFSYKFTDNVAMLIEKNGSLLYESGDKIFRIKREMDEDVLYWATPDKILYDAIMSNIELESENINDIEALQVFELLYVGISKKNDSLSRLFKEPHHGRLNILSNEYTKEEKARMTDELMILLFEVKWFNINSVTVETIDDLFTYTDDEEAIVADAEKAFVSMLDTKYNKVKFKKYPQGGDGLYDKGLQGYAYGINYDMKLVTKAAEFIGKHDRYLERDYIFVQGDEVDIMKVEN